MTPEREHRAGALFLTAIELGSAERDRLLTSIGLQDPALRAEVEALLNADARNTDGFLHAPIAESALSQLELKGVHSQRSPLGAIGPYRVLKELGRGEHTVILLARQDPPNARLVAIKVLSSQDGSAEIVRRFETERRILALMEHRNIARFFETGVTQEGDAYFVMEHVDGGPISTYCSEKSLTLRQRLDLFCQVCSAVEHAHQRGIMHRDLKPTNILVSADSAGLATVKVIDFGVARATGAGLHSFPSHTLHGQLVGTIGYMSPEQIGGDGALVDTRSDVYALGAVLYEILCESPAIVTLDAGPATVITRITIEGPRRPRSVKPSIPDDVEHIITMAMRHEPSKRYPSVAALHDDVERYLSHRPVVARASTPLYRSRRFLMRHRVPVLMLLVLSALLSLALARAWAAERAKFDFAVQIARSYIDDSRHMARTAGERERRRPLLARLENQSESLLAQAPRHPGVMRLRADVLGALGDMTLEDRKASEASRLFAAALSLRERLARDHPASLDYQMDLSVAIVRCGDALKDLGNQAAALTFYERAMSLDTDSVDRDPQSARAATLLAWSANRLAAMAGSSADREYSDMLFTWGLSLMERLNLLETSADARRGLCVAHSHLAAIARRDGDKAAYREHALKAFQFAEAAKDLEPDDRLAQWAYIHARIRFVEAYGETLESERAREFAVDTLDRAAKVARLDPVDEPIHDCFMRAIEAAADQAEGDGDVELSRSLRTKQIDEARRYLDNRPTEQEARHSLDHAMEQHNRFLARHGG